MTKQTDLAYYAFKGCRVSGVKNGKPFSGIVTSRRWHTIQHDTVLVFIDTDEPVETAGTISNGFCMQYTYGDLVADTNYIDWIDPATYPNKERA